MKRILFLSLLVSFASTATAQIKPLPLPKIPPITVPTCPSQFIGEINGTYYWVTENCPSDGNTGFSSSVTMFSVPCCNTMTNTCDCGVSPILPPGDPDSGTQSDPGTGADPGTGTSPGTGTNDPGMPGASTDNPYAAMVIPVAIFQQAAGKGPASVKVSLSDLCKMPEGTEQEINAKLAAIIAAVKQRNRHLNKLLQSAESGSSGNVGGHKGTKERIKIWQVYSDKFAAYLEDTNANGDSAKDKIKRFCDEYIPNNLAHQARWSVAVVKPANGAGKFVPDIPQKNAPLTADQTTFAGAAGISSYGGDVYAVRAKDLKTGADKTVFFKTFTFQKPATANSPAGVSHIGIQVSDAGSRGAKPAKFVDRHRFGHIIETQGTKEVFLVSSWDDLAIKQAP